MPKEQKISAYKAQPDYQEGNSVAHAVAYLGSRREGTTLGNMITEWQTHIQSALKNTRTLEEAQAARRGAYTSHEHYGKFLYPEGRADDWSLEKNTAFMAGAIEAGRTFRVVTPLKYFQSKSTIWSGTKYEIVMLYHSGYHFDINFNGDTIATPPASKPRQDGTIKIYEQTEGQALQMEYERIINELTMQNTMRPYPVQRANERVVKPMIIKPQVIAAAASSSSTSTSSSAIPPGNKAPLSYAAKLQESMSSKLNQSPSQTRASDGDSNRVIIPAASISGAKQSSTSSSNQGSKEAPCQQQKPRQAMISPTAMQALMRSRSELAQAKLEEPIFASPNIPSEKTPVDTNVANAGQQVMSVCSSVKTT